MSVIKETKTLSQKIIPEFVNYVESVTTLTGLPPPSNLPDGSTVLPPRTRLSGPNPSSLPDTGSVNVHQDHLISDDKVDPYSWFSENSSLLLGAAIIVFVTMAISRHF